MLFFKSTDWIRAEVKKAFPGAHLKSWTGNYGTYYYVNGNIDFAIRSPRKAWIKAYRYVRYF